MTDKDKPGRCFLFEYPPKDQPQFYGVVNFRPIFGKTLGNSSWVEIKATCSIEKICPLLKKYGRCPEWEEIITTYPHIRGKICRENIP